MRMFLIAETFNLQTESSKGFDSIKNAIEALNSKERFELNNSFSCNNRCRNPHSKYDEARDWKLLM